MRKCEKSQIEDAPLAQRRHHGSILGSFCTIYIYTDIVCGFVPTLAGLKVSGISSGFENLWRSGAR